MVALTEAQIWKILDQVKDPEIPPVSLVEMGMIRQVCVEGDKIEVELIPTFLGCPAIQFMQAEIESRLTEAGAAKVEVEISLTSWTSDRISANGRQKLKEFGLAPPPYHQGELEIALSAPVSCPNCDSYRVALKNSFGPTLCGAIYYCNNCQQPFERFKPL